MGAQVNAHTHTHTGKERERDRALLDGRRVLIRDIDPLVTPPRDITTHTHTVPVYCTGCWCGDGGGSTTPVARVVV